VSAAQIADRALSRAGADDALARVVCERSLMLRFAANRPTQATAVDDATVEVAVLRDGQLGRASTNRTDDWGLAECARLATSAAELASGNGPGAHPEFAVEGAIVAADGGFDAPTARLDPWVGGAALAAVFEVAARSGSEAHGVWTLGERSEAVAGPGGGREERATDAFMKVVCVHPSSGRSGFASSSARSAGGLDAPGLAEQAARRASGGGEPVDLPAGEYPVVFGHHAVGLLLDALGGTAFNGLAHAEGRGALAGRLARQVASPAVNLADSPRYPLTLPRGFDAEGTPKRPIPLIQDGVALNVVHDRRSAALAGTDSTGHALEPGGHPAGPHPTNLVLAGGGAASVEELCAPVERGIYVTRLWYANVVRPKETLTTAVTRDGTFLIEDGAITRPLSDLRLTDSLLGLLARAQALTSEQRLTSEGDFYGRRFAYGVVCPALRVGVARFTGTAG
jgi:PmbA protein